MTSPKRSKHGRHDIAEAFKARVVNRYSSEENGIIACECEEHSLHIQSETNRVELLDDGDVPVPSGVEGHVVSTPLYNYATPLIRYKIGDMATFTTTVCACQRKLPAIKRVSGRSRQLFRLPDGRRIWPTIPFAELRKFIEMRQIQIVQTAPERIEIRYIPEGDGHANRPAAIAYARHCLDDHDERINFALIPCTSLPRTASGKYFDFISLVADD